MKKKVEFDLDLHVVATSVEHAISFLYKFAAEAGANEPTDIKLKMVHDPIATYSYVGRATATGAAEIDVPDRFIEEEPF